jgi:aminopeptidase-like protein
MDTESGLMLQDGTPIFSLAERLFPICRSITGNGVRETLRIIAEHVPELTVHEVPTGSQCFDWTVPEEWNIRDAWVIDPEGNKIIDFQQHNLHVVGYSVPVDKTVSLEELDQHLHSLPDQPQAIPYVTSYYQPRWGFCLTHHQRQSLQPGDYRVLIDSELKEGSLTYGEILLPGESSQEVFLSTYVCHPSMANNELSGPVVLTFLLKWLNSLPRRRYTYRAVFIPETIGSIVYLSRNWQAMKAQVIAGFNISCVGDDRAYSYLPSRTENTLADQVAQHVLQHTDENYHRYRFLDRGSDERQYCSPKIDLPVATVMRTKYGAYPEYHTSLDNLTVISPEGLFGGYTALQHCLQVLENNIRVSATVPCEPQLGRRGLYPTLSEKGSADLTRRMMDLLAYADGQRTLLEIAEKIETPMWELVPIVEQLLEHQLLEVLDSSP